MGGEVKTIEDALDVGHTAIYLLEAGKRRLALKQIRCARKMLRAVEQELERKESHGA